MEVWRAIILTSFNFIYLSLNINLWSHQVTYLGYMVRHNKKTCLTSDDKCCQPPMQENLQNLNNTVV